jgi:hypothetical protein
MLIWCDYLLVQNYFVLFWYLQPFMFGLRYTKVFGCSPITKHTFPHIHLSVRLGWGLCCVTSLSTIFQFYRGGQFYWWRESWYPEKNPDFITWCCFEYTSPWAGFELSTLVVIGTNCIGSCKSNYHTIITTMAPTSINS